MEKKSNVINFEQVVEKYQCTWQYKDYLIWCGQRICRYVRKHHPDFGFDWTLDYMVGKHILVIKLSDMASDLRYIQVINKPQLDTAIEPIKESIDNKSFMIDLIVENFKQGIDNHKKNNVKKKKE